jgi:hypothetical protein
MTIREALRSRFVAGLIVGLVLFALGALSADAFYQRKRSKYNAPFLTEGFDFNRPRSSDVEWRGPDVGRRLT